MKICHREKMFDNGLKTHFKLNSWFFDTGVEKQLIKLDFF